MYRKYKVNSRPSKEQFLSQWTQKEAFYVPAEAGIAEETPKGGLGTGDNDVVDIVNNSWGVIERQCSDGAMSSGIKVSAVTRWKTIRVFVSSTFTDYHSEREVLVKKVFPALREWCEERRLHLVECDLRWGVPKDTDTRGTIEACLEELDRCHLETDGEPFFLSMLSERCGWIPSIDELPEELKERYSWVPDVSITCMEILHGAYRTKNRNAVFFLRDPDYLKDLPEKFHPRFVDTAPLAKAQLHTLKCKVRERFPARQVFEYKALAGRVDTSSGREKPLIENLDYLAEKTLEFFKEAISEKYPAHGPAEGATEDTHETELQTSLMEMKAGGVVGREAELKVLMDFAEGKNVSLPIMKTDEEDKTYKALLESYGVPETGVPLLCVTADSGLGKSALLAKLGVEAKKKGLQVLYHQIGVSAQSSNEHHIVEKILLNLLTDAQTKLAPEPDVQGNKDMMKGAFAECEASNKQLLIIIDALNQVNSKESTYHLDWLPPRFTGQVRCVVSANSSHFLTMNRLTSHRALQLDLPPIDVATRELVVSNYLGNFNKRLDPAQLSGLVSHDGASTPLWLSISCEELRVFGDFRMLTSKIQELPGSLEGLLSSVISRLAQEDETQCMEKLLCLLYCSPNGLAEDDMKALLGNPKDNQEAPLMTWSTLRRSIKPFIHTVVYWYDGSLRVQLFHQAMKDAVRAKFVTEEAVEKKWHVYLADYYQYYCSRDGNCTENLPYHLEQAGQGGRLMEFYRKDRRSLRVPQFRKVQQITHLRCLRPCVGPFNMKVIICSLCANQPNHFHPNGFQTKTCCFLCGQVTHFHRDNMEAKLCSSHIGMPPPAGRYKCRLCPMMFGDARPHGPPVQMYLCHMCAGVRGPNMCVHLNV